MNCVLCGEPCRLSHWGPIGSGGVCRFPEDPNQDDQGQHVTHSTPAARAEALTAAAEAVADAKYRRTRGEK